MLPPSAYIQKKGDVCSSRFATNTAEATVMTDIHFGSTFYQFFSAEFDPVAISVKYGKSTIAPDGVQVHYPGEADFAAALNTAFAVIAIGAGLLAFWPPPPSLLALKSIII